MKRFLFIGLVLFLGFPGNAFSVTLADGNRYSGRLVGSDPNSVAGTVSGDEIARRWGVTGVKARRALLPGGKGKAMKLEGSVSNPTTGKLGGEEMPESLPADALVRILDKPRRDWSNEDLVRVVREGGIRLVSLMHAGGDGWLKVLDFAPRDEAHLRDILAGGERADGSNLFPGLQGNASDILLQPRPKTAFLDPFSSVPSLVVLAGHRDRDGKPLAQSPDTIIRRAAERVRGELKLDLFALGEVEFFLGAAPAPDGFHNGLDRGYHAASPLVFGEELRREALSTLAEMGVPTKYAHSEVGFVDSRDRDGRVWEQHEIELALAPLPRAAEAVALTRWVLMNLARRHGVAVSFAPLLKVGHAGNGMHVHFSPVANGQHLAGVGPDGKLQDPARWLIGGLARLGAALMAFGNREPGSFARLRQGKEAPTAVVWGRYDRQALIRLPAVVLAADGNMTAPPTVEFRLPDGSAHPYLLPAGVAQAMILGAATPNLESLLERTADKMSGDRAAAVAVPRSVSEVASALREHRDALTAGSVFPSAVIEEALRNLEA